MKLAATRPASFVNAPSLYCCMDEGIFFKDAEG